MEQTASERLAQFGDHTHEYLREFIQFADQKAAFVFAAASGILAFLYTRGAQTQWLRPPTSWSLRSWCAFIGMTSLASTVLFALAVVVPRRKGSDRGFIFWDAITSFESGSAYASAVASLAGNDLTMETLHHCHELAKICQRKYRTLNLAIWSGAVGSLASVFYITFLSN